MCAWDHVVEEHRSLDSRNWRCSRVSFHLQQAEELTTSRLPLVCTNVPSTTPTRLLFSPARTARRKLQKRASASSSTGEFDVRAAMHICMSCNAMQRTRPTIMSTQGLVKRIKTKILSTSPIGNERSINHRDGSDCPKGAPWLTPWRRFRAPGSRTCSLCNVALLANQG
jgi:hypothetical protein